MGWTTGTPVLREVAENVYAYLQPDGTWWINNTGFLVTPQGVISIDTCSTEARTRAYIAAIASVTDRAVRAVLNTHHHGDHTFGNYLFDGAAVLGHEGVRTGINAWGPPRSEPYWTEIEWGGVELEPPFLTFTEGLTVWMGDHASSFRHVGTPAHTTNDSYLWMPAQKVLFCGDIAFNGGTPFTVQGSVRGSIDVIERVLLPLGAETVVCGHGPVAGPEVLESTVRYLRFVEETAAAARAAGLSPLAAARETDLGEFADLGDSERLAGNLHRAYAELDGNPLGSQLDLPAVLDDMLTFNGGPLQSHA